jgi:hypothetical protein
MSFFCSPFSSLAFLFYSLLPQQLSSSPQVLPGDLRVDVRNWVWVVRHASDPMQWMKKKASV